MKRIIGLAIGAFSLLGTSFFWPAPGTGLIEGHLHYPACSPAADLQVCAIRDRKDDGPICTKTFDLDANGIRYQLEVPAGRWLVYSTAPETVPGRRAFYSNAVRCGLDVECRDHAPIVVNVREGGLVQDVDPDDWFDDEATEPAADPAERPVS